MNATPSVEAARAAILEAQNKVDAFVAAADDAAEAIRAVTESLEDLDLPHAFFGSLVHTVEDVARYIENEGDGNMFEFSDAKERVTELRELFEVLVRDVPVSA
jgi:hypothetical protein